MRRASTCLAVLALAALALPAVVSAAPEVKLKAVAIPIPKPGGGTYPGTGNFYGKGAAVEVEYKIASKEYGGFPPPIIGINFYLPKGTKLHPAGFKTCPTKVVIEEKEPEKCPAASSAGPVGKAIGVVSFGKERVPEEVAVSSYFAPGGGLNFFVKGVSPVLLEIPTTGRYVNVGGAEGFGPKFIGKIPLVSTVPGAPFASTEFIKVKVGAAFKKGKELVSYGTLPKKGQCPKGGFNIKSEVIFAENGEESKPQIVIASYKAPCPRR
jgi:hypothetical protein